MKRIAILIFILACAGIASAQFSTKEVIKVTTDITGQSTCVQGRIYYNETSLVNWERNNAGVCAKITSGGTPGNVVGPASATDNHLAVFDGTTGKLIKDGGAIPTATPAGSNTQVQYNNSGVFGGAANLTIPSSSSVLVTGSSFGLTGNISGAGIFGTSGIRYKNVASTLTDTSSSGTVATNYTNVFGANTLAASSATTITNAFNTYVSDPVQGTNVTLTNKWALGADSAKFGTSNQLTVSNAGLVTVNASGTGDGITITPGSAGAGTTIAAITSGTNSNVVVKGAGTGGLTLNVGQTTSATTDLLINPTTKASGNLLTAQVNSTSQLNVTSAGNVGANIFSGGAGGFEAYTTQANAISRTVSGRAAILGDNVGAGIRALIMGSNYLVSWTSVAAGSGSDAAAVGQLDTTISRNAAGIVQIGTTTNNALGSLLLTNLTASGTLSVTGTITPSQTNGIVGTTTNNNANAGSVGEYVEGTLAQVSATSVTTGTTLNVISISLTAGDWDVDAQANFIPLSSTAITYLGSEISTTSATFDFTDATSATTEYNSYVTGNQGANLRLPTTKRISLSGTTTVYLVARAGFSVSTMTVWGIIHARRVR